MWQILLAHPNYETGGARQSAVAAQPMHVWRVCQLKSGFKYPDHSNNCTFSPVRAKLKTREASKVKFACFKGIVHPTHFQKQVGWGTWLNPNSTCGWGFPPWTISYSPRRDHKPWESIKIFLYHRLKQLYSALQCIYQLSIDHIQTIFNL